MNVRIVLADEREAKFFDASKPRAPLTARGSLRNVTGDVTEVELETDADQRGTSGVSHGADVQARYAHAAGANYDSEQDELTLFAEEVAQRIDSDRIKHKFDKLVLVAPPKVLKLLRQSLAGPSQAMLAAEIPVLHLRPDAMLKALPLERFWTA